MTVNYKEVEFENVIEKYLINESGYIKTLASNFDRNILLHTEQLIDFIKSTQSKEWKKLSEIHGNDVQNKLISRLVNELNTRGTIDVLRHGIVDYGVKLKVAYFKPATTLNEESIINYNKNILHITRQLKFSNKNEKSIDIVLSLNGLPLISIELKNPLTGQNIEDAKKQYINDRSPKELFFDFKKRAVAHFAVDTDLVYVTTKLNGASTIFLPFNKGNNMGAGNPEVTNGYKTSYLWEEVLQKDSILEIFSKYLHLESKEKKTLEGKIIKSENIIFPRYHQLDVVRKLESHIIVNGVGQNYLIQHSAGSGKSNSIAWLAHRLSNLHNNQDEIVFNSIIVITDRKVLDQQLQNTIYQFEHKHGVVQKIDENSQQLADAITSETKIIITTLQKFPFVVEKLDKLPNRRYAIIVDEAHSSQTGESSKSLKEVLSASNLEEAAKIQSEFENLETDAEEEVLKTILSRKKQSNLSFFAFTATPKQKTLEIFGQQDVENKYRPFHIYSMKQAIEENFILDVLKGYTTYDLFFKITKQIENDPKVDKKKASRAIARFVSLHPHNLAQKTEIIIEHFRQLVRQKIGGQAKAMVVTSSRAHAVRYKIEFDKYISENNYNDIKTLVAFSGKVNFNGSDFTEPDMNKVGYKELPEKFQSNEYQVLLVAEKYQTGFDQPLLHTMYVDKKLSGVKAVQTLSRLNRTCPGKSDTFVLDFINSWTDIKDSFQPYYEYTTLESNSDPNKLYDLKQKLESYQIFWKVEVDNFSEIFFKQKNMQSDTDHSKLYKFLQPAEDRFKSKPKEEQEEFKKTIFEFLRLYSFISQVVPIIDLDIEKLYAFCQFLIRKLPKKLQDTVSIIGDDIALKYYRLQKNGTFNIELENETGKLKGIAIGQANGASDEQEQLSKIIDTLNKKFETDFSQADELFFNQLVEDCLNDENLINQAKNNPIDNFKFGFDEIFVSKLIERMDQNQNMFTRIMDDGEFQKMVMKLIMTKVYEHGRKN